MRRASWRHSRSASLKAACDDLLGVGLTQLESGGGANERLAAYLGAKRDALGGCRLGRLAYDPGLEEEELRAPTARYFKELELRLIAVFEELQEGSPVSSPEARDLAAAALSVIQGGYVLARVHRDPRYLTRAVASFLSLLSCIERQAEATESRTLIEKTRWRSPPASTTSTPTRSTGT